MVLLNALQPLDHCSVWPLDAEAGFLATRVENWPVCERLGEHSPSLSFSRRKHYSSNSALAPLE